MVARDRGVFAISVAARMASMEIQNLRVYERRGLLEPDRTSGERNQYGFCKESSQNASAARSQRESQSDLPSTVSRARGKQAAQVGTCGQQNQPCQHH